MQVLGQAVLTAQQVSPSLFSSPAGMTYGSDAAECAVWETGESRRCALLLLRLADEFVRFAAG